ncbi:MAG TPA: tetratricopeptide repeat protein [Burkholderiales bacterium]|nr:tetratricopeptide repeat protein [Burkholderiales bacterium]
MRRYPAARILAAAALAAAASGALAQSDAERCAAATGNPDVAIEHCTRAIESGQHSGEALAKLHYNRGVEWAAKGDHDRAIADYDAAIRLSPKFADAYYNRGHAWAGKGDSDRAISDYEAAIRLNPKDPAAYIGRAVELALKGDYAKAAADYGEAIARDPKSATAYFGRGRVRFYAGDHARAVSDLEQALKLDPNAYTALWLYLARKRGGVADAEALLDADSRPHRAGGWPAAVVVFYLGRTDLDSVMAASADSDPKRQAEQRCEAHFYLAHWRLLRGERERAAPLLEEARSRCPKEFFEYEGAIAELRRLERR